MSTELLSIVVGGPGLVALVVAVLGFMQNRRTLRATQPKTEAERMAIEINSLRALLEESRTVRDNDRTDHAYRIAELKAEIQELRRLHRVEMDRTYERFATYLEEHTIPKPHWWPARRHNTGKQLESDAGD